MASIHFVEMIQHFPTSRTNGVGKTHEFFVVTDVHSQVIHEFGWHVQRYFWHGWPTRDNYIILCDYRGHTSFFDFTYELAFSSQCSKKGSSDGAP